MGLLGYIGRRVLLTIPVILGVTFITFILSRVIVPDPARAWAGIRAAPGEVAALTAEYHLNAPLYIQYFYYMRDLITGNWGVTPSTGRSVLADIGFFFPATIELALVALLITIVLGISLGVIASIYYNRSLDHSIRIIYLTGFSSPPFLVALAVLIVFGYILKWLPTQGELSPNLVPPTHITGMYILDSLLTGNWVDLKNSILHVIMPASALALTYFGIVTRITRASMLEVMKKDFIRAEVAKGLTKNMVILKHALRNALISTVTVLGLILASLLGGAIVIETIFSWPGIGYYATQAILNLDFPSVMGVTLVFTLGVVIANLIADIAYAALDPRIKL
jgi:peptide/nickel transport system permease protein